MNILLWLLFGAGVGMIVSFYTKAESTIPIIVFAMVGSLFGGLLATFLFGTTIQLFAISPLVIALLMSSIVLYLFIRIQRKHYKL